ncbi:MAG: DegQ family serine endoprotease [Thermodesulfobacteriota bacterium]|nr:DegQ family serine endoprotease [Thermodesulfobacteriota bacterium]
MMNNEHPGKRTYIIAWTLFCLVSGFILATLLIPVTALDAQTTSLLPTAPGSFSELVKEARQSVVNISAVKIIKGRRQTPFHFESPFGPNDPFRDFFDQFFRDQVPREFRQQSLGSGFIIGEDGFILTNNHVVEKTDEIMVKLADEREFKAKIIGKDPKTDLALIRIETSQPLKSLPLGDSDELEVGDWVVAIGNPFGLGNTVTAGIVSAKYRNIGASSYDNFIQTDAPINPGNSGGPLLNTAGEVIGINTAIFSQSGGSIGIGFAVPISMVKDLLPQLKKGKVVRGWLGVVIQKITPDLKDKFDLKDEKGALVADVTAEGPADKAGIKRGDVIVSFDGQDIKEMKDLPYIVASTPIDKSVAVEVIRKGRKKAFQIEVGELKEEKEHEEVAEKKPKLGMTLEEITPQMARNYGLSQSSGLVVVHVEGNTAAEEAGIMRGDIILEMDQAPVKKLDEFQRRIQGYENDDTILLLVKRRGATLYLTLKIRE